MRPMMIMPGERRATDRRTLLFHHETRERDVIMGRRDISNYRVERPIPVEVPPWLVPGAWITTGGKYAGDPRKVLAVDAALTVVEGGVDIWSVDTKIVAACWHACEVTP